MYYCISGNIREVLFFANFARRTNLRIGESREIVIIIALPIIEIDNSRIPDVVNIPKSQIRENINTLKLPDAQYI